MRYYKVLSNDSDYIGVASSYDLRKYQKKHNIIIVADEESANFIQINEDLYRDNWMCPCEDAPVVFINAQVIEISVADYDILSRADTPEEVLQTVVPQKVEEVKEQPDSTIKHLKEMKIRELSDMCQEKIEDGIKYNNEYYSFKIEDQIELQSLYRDAKDGKETLYHANSKPYRVYSPQEIIEIYEQLDQNKTYQKIYFNCLKQYVLSLRSARKIDEVEYGMKIPEKYQTDIYKSLL